MIVLPLVVVAATALGRVFVPSRFRAFFERALRAHVQDR
jgi:hypothetical protein